MNVFVDYLGHSDLHYSLHLLFEKRLKANLFRPIGEEWRRKGLFLPSPDPLEVVGGPQLIDGIYHFQMKMEPDSGYYTQKAVMFEKFLEMDFDLAVTTFCQHEELFYNLIKSYKPNAVFVRQIGNIHEKPLGFCKNILLGALTPMPPNVNCVVYHPESYEGYCYTPPTNHKAVKNFASNLYSHTVDFATWNKCESSLTDFTFKMYGENNRDGSIPHLLMPQAMKDSAFIWHTKAHGGGGFIARQALACGRPCVVRTKYAIMHHELAKNLFIDSVNCIDLDLGVHRASEKIRSWSQPDRHIEVCRATAEKFKKDVNFDQEAIKIEAWLGNLRRR